VLKVGSRRPRRATTDLLARRDRRRTDLERQRALTLQGVIRITSVLVLPHPEREALEVRRLQPNFETEAATMQFVAEHERALGRHVFDVSAKNLGCAQGGTACHAY
jgi:hypothetical protein